MMLSVFMALMQLRLVPDQIMSFIYIICFVLLSKVTFDLFHGGLILISIQISDVLVEEEYKVKDDVNKPENLKSEY